MDFINILLAVSILGLMGILFAMILGFASKIFAVETDERLPLIIEALPGANCGGCGYAGCSNFANAVIDGKAAVSGCPVGGAPTASAVAEIMGVVADTKEKQTAYVFCSGGDKAKQKFDFAGVTDCVSATQLGAGTLSCSHGCLGFGTCKKACDFGAISIKDGVAVVDSAKCTECAACVSACPKNIITFIPAKTKVSIPCSSCSTGGIVRGVCEVGCIGCKLCEKACPFDAVHIENNLAKIDYSKCKNCGKCVTACPRKLIINSRKPAAKPIVKPPVVQTGTDSKDAPATA